MIQTPQEKDRIAVERELCARSFRYFYPMAWRYVEPLPLQGNWHMDLIADGLDLVARGQIKNLLICIPPGMSKSLLVNVLWPAWVWTLHAHKKIISSSYGQSLSEKSARLSRDLILSPWYQKRWGDTVSMGKGQAAQVKKFENTAKGFRMATSVGGQATGDHGDILIADDLAKAKDAQGRAAIDPAKIKAGNDFWFKTMSTRNTNIKTTARVVVGQRLHHIDTPGLCLADGYVAVVLPMEYDPDRKCKVQIPIFENPIGSPDRGKCTGVVTLEDPRTNKGELLDGNRFPQDAVDKLREHLGVLGAAAQLDQDPSPLGGAVWQRSWMYDENDQPVNRWTEIPAGISQIIVADCTFSDASTADYVSIQCWGTIANNFYLIDRITGRWDVNDTARELLGFCLRHPGAVGVYVEDKANGPAVMQILEDEIPGLQPWSPGRSNKIERASSAAALGKAGRVFWPPEARAPWFKDYADQHVKFPVAPHDDDVDGSSMGLLILHGDANRVLQDMYDEISNQKRR